jgi:hypothetical protein
MPRKPAPSPPTPKKAATGRGLLRIVAYVHADEHEALVEFARRQRVSQGEVVRRALRKFLRIAD